MLQRMNAFWVGFIVLFVICVLPTTASAKITPSCGAAYGAPSVGLSDLQIAACSTTATTFQTAGTIIGWNGGGGGINLYLQGSAPCSFSFPGGQSVTCDADGDASYSWSIPTPKALQVLAVSYSANGAAPRAVSIYALDIGTFTFTALTPGSVGADGAVTNASASLQIPGNLGAFSVQGLQLTSSAGTGKVVQDSAALGSVLQIVGDLQLQADGATLAANLVLPDLLPSAASQKPVSVSLGTLNLAPTGGTLTRTISQTTLPMGVFAIDITEADINSTANQGAITLKANFKFPSYLPLGNVSATLPLSVQSGGSVAVACPGATLNSSGSTDLGSGDATAVHIQTSGDAFHCTGPTGTVDGVYLNASLSLPSVGTLIPNVGVAISSGGLQLCPPAAPVACNLAPLASMTQFQVDLLSLSGGASKPFGVAGLGASISGAALVFNKGTGGQVDRLSLDVTGTLHPAGLTISSRTYVVDYGGANGVSVECPVDQSPGQIDLGFLKGSIKPACDGQALAGAILPSPTTITLGGKPLTLNVDIRVAKDGVQTADRKPLNLVHLVPAPVSFFGALINPTTLTVSLAPQTSVGPIPADQHFTIEAAGTVALPTWLSRASFTVPDTTIDLNTGHVIVGGAIKVSMSSATILGATVDLNDNCADSNVFDIQNRSVSLCGTLTLPEFLNGTTKKFAAAASDQPPTLVPSKRQLVFGFKFAIHCSQDTSSPTCGFSGSPQLTLDPALQFNCRTSKCSPDADVGCPSPIDFDIFRLCINSLAFSDTVGNQLVASAVSSEPTALSFDASVAPGRQLSTNKFVEVTGAVNGSGFDALMSSGTIEVKLGQGEAQISNVELGLHPYSRSLHGDVAIIPNTSASATVYFSDVGLDMTRSAVGKPWNFKFGGKPDLPRTALSFGQFAISALFARWIFK